MHSLSQLFAPALIYGELSVYQFIRDIEKGDIESFMNCLTAFFAGNSYMIQGDLELYFQNVMSIMLKMMGLYVKTEYQTSNGRIDIVFDTDKYVYIIELKRDQSADIALKQIEEKGYDKPFLASGKQIIKLGINFSSETKTIGRLTAGLRRDTLHRTTPRMKSDEISLKDEAQEQVAGAPETKAKDSEIVKYSPTKCQSPNI